VIIRLSTFMLGLRICLDG